MEIMMHTVKLCIAIVAAEVLAFTASAGATVTFNFDTGTPTLSTGQNVPLDQTSGGVTAHFSSPSGMAFSVQSNATTSYTLSQFSGNYLWPNSMNRNRLDIKFSEHLSGITLTFATIEYHDPGGTPSSIQLTAYENSTATPPVGSATAYGSNIIGDSYPQGALSFTSAQPFNLVEIVVLNQPQGATEFLADNITVVVKCIVEFKDFVQFASHWFESGCISPGYCGGADFDKNGSVNEQDLSDLTTYWLSDCPENWPWQCVIGFTDFARFASHWLESDCVSPGYCGGADFDKNGSVDMHDLNYLSTYWLTDCPSNWPWP